jgi:hypothetical protein
MSCSIWGLAGYWCCCPGHCNCSLCSPSKRVLGKVEWDTGLWLNTQLYAQGNADAANFIIITISKKDAAVDKVPKQPTTHTSTHIQSNQSSIIIQMMTNNTLLHSGKRHLAETRTGLKAAIYWQLLAGANSRRCGSLGVLVWRVEVTILTSLHPLASSQGILRVC